MPTGVVVDTNILIHANNVDVYCYQHCINILNHLINSDEDYINVDINFDFTNEHNNKSAIGEEYLEHVSSGSLAEAMLLQVIADDRIRFWPAKPHYHIVKKIGLYRKPTIKKSDRHFIGIAIQTPDKIFISEDFEDFPQIRRNKIDQDLEVRIIQSYEIFQG